MNDQIFFAQNPWQVRPWRIEPALVNRSATQRLHKRLSGNYLQILCGARRTGKTTIMQQIIHALLHEQKTDPKSIFYVNFDDLELRSDLAKNPHLLLDMITRYAGKTMEQFETPVYFCIDEAQKFPAYFDQIKLYFDSYKNRLKFLLTGSAALEISAKTAETFAGRAQLTSIYPFSLKEITAHSFVNIPFPSVIKSVLHGDFDERKITALQSRQLPFQPALNQIMDQVVLWGLLPEVFLATDTAHKRDYLFNYRLTYLERDIRSLAQVGRLEDYSRVLDFLFLQLANVLDKTRIAREIGIAANTVRKYLTILEQTFVALQVRPYTGSLRKRMIKSPKIYFFDVGFHPLISHLDSLAVLKNSGRIGAIFENICFNELVKVLSDEEPPPQIFFWRTSAGAEVDFVIQYGNRLLPVEVKYKNSIDQRDAQNLRKFKAHYPEQVERMIVVYTGSFAVQQDVIYIPLWML